MASESSSPASLAIPYLRSCKEEFSEPINGEVKGYIPEWLHGNLIRTGPGLMEVGPDKYHHIFDGLALLHRFSFQDGKVAYQNRFLKSNAYNGNMKANRIVMSEFGTTGVPDPCKTIFQRFSSFFSDREMTDNCCVNIARYTSEIYSCTETNFIWRIDPETLDSIERVDLSKFVATSTATAHPHEDRDGTVYNFGHTHGAKSCFNLISFEPKDENSSSVFDKGKLLCRIPPSSGRNPSYVHSFGMTEHYFILVEQPLFISLPKMAFSAFTSATFAESLYWNPSQKARFHLIRRDGPEANTVVKTHYIAEPFFVFHHINAYEENDQVVVDLCCFKDGSVIKALYAKALEEYLKHPQDHGVPLETYARRYVLPLNVQDAKDTKENLVKLENCNAKAFVQQDGSVLCEPEMLTGEEPVYPELPRINYESYNGKKYRFFYAVGKKIHHEDSQLVKVDVEQRTVTAWMESGAVPSEPVFVPDPNAAANDEDAGVLLASLLYKTDDKRVSLVVLDAKTMKELGRADFVTPSSVPADFHGLFIPKK